MVIFECYLPLFQAETTDMGNTRAMLMEYLSTLLGQEGDSRDPAAANPRATTTTTPKNTPLTSNTPAQVRTPIPTSMSWGQRGFRDWYSTASH